jgi:tRNA1Val (adenine37-N6)-methyltransferase
MAGAAIGETRVGEDGETLDAFLRGRLRLYQPRRGARVSLDAFLLADFASTPKLGRVLDLCCGGGVIGLALALADPEARVVGVELQPALAALARRNAALNAVEARVSAIEADARALPVEPESFDLVVTNPPWREAEDGRAAPQEQRALSRHELTCTLADVAAAARRALRPRGRLAVVYPAERLGDLVSALVAADLRPRAVRAVHSVEDEPARRVLVEGVRAYRGGVTLRPPLVVHGPDRHSYTAEAAKILGDG